MAWKGSTFVCLCAFLGLFGCSDLKDSALSPAPSPGVRLTFEKDIQPVLLKNCASCHTGAAAKGGYDLSTLSGTLGAGSDAAPNAIPGNADSRLVAILQGGTHAGYAGGSAALLRKWVVEDSMGLVQPAVHPQGWMDVKSAGFHGRKVQEAGYGMASCQSCHGADYKGGISGKACTDCHAGTPEACTACHGSGANPAPPLDLDGNLAPSSRGVGAHQAHLMGGAIADAMACEICHAVPRKLGDPGHVDSARPAEVRFAGLASADGARPTWNGQACATTYCHGSASPKWTAGPTEAACGTCHGLPPAAPHPQVQACAGCHGAVVDASRKIVDRALHVNGKVEVVFGHPDGFEDPASPNFHGLAIRKAGWKLTECQGCHGTDYKGGSAKVSCLTCHPKTPEDCGTCHGGASSPAPPPDLDRKTATASRGVGAHQAHLKGSALSGPVSCAECHAVPSKLADAGHVDTALPAEVAFGALAKADGAKPSWNGTACANTYCHGNFEGGGKATPAWTQAGQAACGTCHGTPPPVESGHPPVKQCSLCHPRVADDNLNILNPALHINGKVDIGQ